jgi:hypothetical protein
VVFWDVPGRDALRLRVLSALRRRHLRLRWQGDEVWLLAAGAEPELFAGEPSGVVEPAAGAAFGDLVVRSLSCVGGLVLGVVAAPAWLWLRRVREPRGAGSVEGVDVTGREGHNITLRFAVDASGRVLPLIWQWAVAGALVRGDLDIWGLQPERLDIAAADTTVISWWETWRSDLRRPGLSGPWVLRERDAAPGSELRRTLDTVGTVLAALWLRPGGIERVTAAQPTVPARATDRVEGD